MKYIPIPSKWKQYNVKEYLAKPIQLQYIHIVLMIITLIIFILFMIYFTSLTYDEVVEIGAIKLSASDDKYVCISIGSRSSDNFDFVSHSAPMNNTNYVNYTFINYNPVANSTYPYLPGPIFSSWRYQPYSWGIPKPLDLSTNDGSMNYSIDKGNAEDPSACKRNLFQQLCNVTNVNNNKYTNNASIKAYFWYDIVTVFNVSRYTEKLKWYYNNTPNIEWDIPQFTLFYLWDKTGSIGYSAEYYNFLKIPRIPYLYTQYNSTFTFPSAKWLKSETRYFALTNGGSMSSVWDLCKSRFAIGHNISVYMGWQTDYYYQNQTVFKIDPQIKGMVECWYNDPIYGLIKTDYYDSYGQNDIIPTPSNETGILIEIENNLFDYSDALTTISNGDASYVRIDDEDIITTNDVLERWQNNICFDLISGYCDWIDVPPYFCKKNIHKTMMESISLSLSPTTTAYSILLLSFLFVIKCKSFTLNTVQFSKEQVDMEDAQTSLVKF